ncbi:transcriptional regulator, AraC family [Methylocella silvestris BL2]|uniref:Transcriptional regulator, AraC family n=1 Tax=Methylocella silvestris (strain DSM 15510 / CIP 108128 / LMG 27833 / NCIMB 13906 / BL2) TaxID=395965 RepID=B8ESU5_METSB|nr:AraC family transcriptional regulator [Methylocella silvestris]ACK50430.1 transcriptional regulator, AraC family [Methylocella silvestris BL2]
MDTTTLQRHSLLEEAPPDLISRHACMKVAQHRLHLCGRSLHDRGYLRHLSLGNVDLSSLGFGSEAVVEGAAPAHYYYIQMVLSGQLGLESQGNSVVVDCKSLAVINPSRKLSLHHSEDCRKLIVRIRSDVVERELANILGSPVRDPVNFVSTMGADGPGLRRLIRTIDYVCQEVDDPFSRCETVHVYERIEGLLCSAILTGVPNDYSEEISRLGEHNGPSYLRRAERYVKSRLSETISIDDLVNASGASMRTLYKVFNTHHNATPMGYVKRIRLEHARRELENIDGSVRTVAEVAMAVGMEHLGNFAADYKKIYHELPSETLRRNRQ